MRFRAAVAALVLVPAIAHSQPDDQASKEAEATADLNEGRALVKEGLYDAAIERFEASFALVPDPQTQFAIAEAYRAKGDTANAVRAYNLYRSLTAGSVAATPAPPAPPADARPASPEIIDESQLPHAPEAPPRPVLPRALTKRPLLLPADMTEETITGAFAYQQLGSASWAGAVLAGGLRFGLGVGEIAVSAELLPYHSSPSTGTLDVPVFQHVQASAAVRVSDDTGIGARIVGNALDSDFRSYVPGMYAGHKFRSDAGALELSASASYVNTKYTFGAAIGAGATAELQVAPAAAIEIHGEVSQVWVRDGVDRSQHTFAYGVAAVIAASDHFDVAPLVLALPVGDTDSYLLGLQLSGH